MDVTRRPSPEGRFAWISTPAGAVLRCEPLAEVAAHAFTTRELRLRTPVGDDPAAWAEVARVVGRDQHSLVRLHQVHGGEVHVLRKTSPRPNLPPEADILVSDDPDVALAVQAADCVPLLIADRDTGAVAAAHAGWRGTAAGVAGKTVRALEQFGARPTNLVAAIGPCIGPCCYEVGEELLAAFARGGHSRRAIDRWFWKQNGRYRLDLWRATREQLEAAGVPAARIFAAGLCSATHRDWFCSYRMEGAATGRMAAVIRPGPAT